MSMSQIVHTAITTDADTKGLKDYDSSLRKIENTGNTVGDTLKTLAKVMAAGFSIRGVFKLAEDFGEMSGLLTSTAERMGKSLIEVQNIAKASANQLNEDVFLYSKLFSSATLAVQIYGGNMQEAGKIATALTASLKLSGATASETAMVMEQASKMFASGETNTRAFLSIAVKSPVLLDQLSKKFKMNSLQLKTALQDGTISMKQLYKSIGDTADHLASQVQRGPMNFSHFMSQVRNELMYFVGGIEESTQILSGIFKSTLMILRAFFKTVQGVVDMLGGWEMAFRLVGVALFMVKKDLIFMKGMQLVGWLKAITMGSIAAGKGILFTGRMINVVKGMILGLSSLGASFLITELMAMAEGRPNVIGYALFVAKESIGDFIESIKHYCNVAWETISGIADAIWQKMKGVYDKVASIAGGLLGRGRKKQAAEPQVDPTLVPPGLNQKLNGGSGSEVINNNNQSVKIEINGSGNVEETQKAVEKALQKTVTPDLNFEKLNMAAQQ